jgi:hypothetical protein
VVVSCRLAKHNVIKCKVTFPKARTTKGTIRIRFAHGARVVALGHGAVRRGAATVTLRGRRRVGRGRWTVTLVLTQPGRGSSTTQIVLRLS